MPEAQIAQAIEPAELLRQRVAESGRRCRLSHAMIRRYLGLECPLAGTASSFRAPSATVLRLHRRFRPSITRFILLIKLLKSLFTSTTAGKPERSTPKLAITSLCFICYQNDFQTTIPNFSGSNTHSESTIYFPMKNPPPLYLQGKKQVRFTENRSFTAV